MPAGRHVGGVSSAASQTPSSSRGGGSLREGARRAKQLEPVKRLSPSRSCSQLPPPPSSPPPVLSGHANTRTHVLKLISPSLGFAGLLTALSHLGQMNKRLPGPWTGGGGA